MTETESISKTQRVDISNLKSTEDTRLRRGLIAQAIFISIIVGLVVCGLVIITQLQDKVENMEVQLAPQGNQSFRQMKWLEENLTSEINNSFFKLKNISTNDLEAFNSKLNEQQISLNQCIEYVSSLNSSHRRFMKSVIQGSPKSCTTVNREYAKIRNNTGGVFNIYPELGDKPVEVYCDLVTDGDGWIVFQRRMDGTENFYRGWNDYVNGFGEKDREMWLGLETIHQLTKDGNYELRVDLEDFNGATVYAKYGSFSISSASENYTLLVGEYNGTAGDSLTYHNNMEFSTKDSDNDQTSGSCAITWSGAWWYKYCYNSNLNGIYYQDGRNDKRSVTWYTWKFNFQSLKFSEMKFRKRA
uniref:microfibril-associated glycoprotein 4-like n=1 Tax=Styela clava TaxID=7725 RepID=UPI00193A8FA0|nr:microfibril-associated glycoprotein 4-like [Styela clava]